MSPYRRNILVGTTVLGALIVLGWMILKFGDRPAKIFSTPSIAIHFISDRADGLADGSNISYRGVSVGRVKGVKRTEGGNEVLIDAEVDKQPPLPANLEGSINFLSPLGATATMSLDLVGPTPEGELAVGATVKAHFVGLALLPPEFSDLARELKAAAQQLRESQVILHFDEQVKKAGKLLDSANQLVGDPKLREDIKAALANIRSATEDLNRLSSKLEKLSDSASGLTQQMTDRLAQISKTLDHFQSIAAKIDTGQGTAGQMVNDPKLYQAMVDSARELNLTITDLKRLVEQWEQEGVSLKVK